MYISRKKVFGFPYYVEHLRWRMQNYHFKKQHPTIKASLSYNKQLISVYEHNIW